MPDKRPAVILSLLVVLGASCSADTTVDGQLPDASSPDSDVRQDALSDTPRADASDANEVDAAPDSGSCAPLPPAPLEPIWPTPGEVYYVQLGLGGFSLGESALVVGPQGSITAVDVGNDSHDDDIREMLTALVDTMNAAGFAARSSDTIDHVVVTHYHADHADGIADLLDAVSLNGRIVSRGMYDLTEASNLASAEKMCRALENNPGSAASLCTGPQPSSCDSSTWSGTYPSSDCSGLSAADLLDPDDGSGPSFLGLGEARLTFLGANGVMAGESFAEMEGPIDTQDSNGDNARSVIALLSHGRFRMLLTGDLTGGGDGTDDVESFYAARIGQVSDIDSRGVDVLHAGHHGRKTSSNATWLDRLLPADGNARNVVMGISTAHLNSPHSEVLERIEAQGMAGGSIWATTVATGGDSTSSLVDADGGRVVVATVVGGDGYVIQAVDANEQVIASRVFAAARCTR